MRPILVFLAVLCVTRVTEMKSFGLSSISLARNRRTIEADDSDERAGARMRIFHIDTPPQDTFIPLQDFKTCTDTAHNSTFLQQTISRVQQQAPQDLLLYWKILSNNVPIGNQYGIVKMAFRLWSEAVPLTFQDALERDADILVEFREGETSSLVTFRNDKPVVVITFKGEVNESNQVIAISHALSHSLGHLFGLEHSADPTSVMYPSHTNNNSLFLSKSTEVEARKVMGPCRVKFNLVVDVVEGSEYKTYFFSDEYAWLYSNQHQSSIYGGLEIENYFPSLPKALDTLLVVSDFEQRPLVLDVFAFKDDVIYHLNSSAMEPIKIFSFNDFNCSLKPSSVKNTFFSNANSLIYLFENSKIWEYEYDDFVAMKCPRRLLTFKQLFHTSPHSEHASGFDHFYFSHHHNTFFFFKNDELYKAKDSTYWSRSSERYLMSLEHLGKWWLTFPDVCYTDPLNFSNS